MGNSFCSFPEMFDKLQLPNLERMSTYGKKEQNLDKAMVDARISQSQGYDRQSMVKTVMEATKTNQFSDQKFKLDKTQKARLSQLLNYKKNKIKIYERSISTQHSNFAQLNIEFSYLSSVFYFYCNKKVKEQWLSSVIQFQKVTQQGYYILNYYCNGTNHAIVIDDYVPTNKESFIYLRIITGQEIWPLLMEKAWAKQIGSYSKALGLSPEDAFQQITGIPSYSYQITSNKKKYIRNLIQDCSRQQKWITFVARQGLSDILNRHVFYLKAIENRSYTIISPYTKFKFDQYQQAKRGQVRISQENLYKYFEYVVVGHYKPGFKNSCLHIKSKSHEQLIFEFNIKQKQQISIRFNQFYKGYISEDYKDKYKYSPVLMQIYQLIEEEGANAFILRQNAQGCKRSHAGARSVYFSKDIFQQFNPGRYFIRMQIAWSHQSNLNEGNLNIYSLNGEIKAQKIQNNNQFLFEVYPSLIKAKLKEQGQQDKTVNAKQIDIRSIEQHKLKIITYYKDYTTLMMFVNEQDVLQKFQVNFQKSQNIIIRGGKVSAKKTLLQIKGNSQLIIEIVPQKILQESTIDNYQIIKIQQKQY